MDLEGFTLIVAHTSKESLSTAMPKRSTVFLFTLTDLTILEELIAIQPTVQGSLTIEGGGLFIKASF